MPRLLACKCTDTGCDHWTIVLREHHDPDNRSGESIEEAILTCATCGETHEVSLQHHDTLTTKEV